MPATESTWRNTKLLHHIFAVSGVVLTISTIWMLYKDHVRSWKTYQSNAVNIDLKMTKMRQEQYETGDALVEHNRLAAALVTAQAQPAPAELLSQFQSQLESLNKAIAEISQHHAYSEIAVDFRYIENTARRLDELAKAAQEKRQTATAAIAAADKAAGDSSLSAEDRTKLEDAARKADREATAAEEKAGAVRAELIGYLQTAVAHARAREDKALGIRKFKSADVDAAKANLDIAIRDNLSAAERQNREKDIQRLIEEPNKGLAALTDVYQTLSAGRKRLEATLKAITAPVEKAKKAHEDSVAELDRLRKQYADDKETYFQLSLQYPFVFGKKITTLPIIDAFNSVWKIENLWSEDLVHKYGSFSEVRRFDRCTTCHQSMQKSQPGAPTEPLYVRDKEFLVTLTPPPKDAPPVPRRDAYGKPLPL
ncbi:MAG TPA: hypothetical protein VFV87_21825, partial [Pirellulaceae bacterium]|nr:hypothetical protein [Pirellulaceae bacterium]